MLRRPHACTCDHRAMADDQTPPRNALIARWEALPPGRQFRNAYVGAVVVLAVLHLGGIAVGVFPHLPIWLGCMYAITEALPIAGLAVLVTQGEIARRRGVDLKGDPDA
jgi:hypothetical protein